MLIGKSKKILIDEDLSTILDINKSIKNAD